MCENEDHRSLHDMLDHSKEALTLMQGRTRSDLVSDRMLELSIVRLLEIVGEAANRVSPALKTRLPSIPWPQMISLRNRLIHGYDAVDLDILWEIIKCDVPQLIDDLETYLQAEGGQI